MDTTVKLDIWRTEAADAEQILEALQAGSLWSIGDPREGVVYALVIGSEVRADQVMEQAEATLTYDGPLVNLRR